MKVIQVYQTNPFINGQGGGVRYVKNLVSGLKISVDNILFLGIGDSKKTVGNINLQPITNKITGYIYFLCVLMCKLPFLNLSQYDVVHVHRLYFAIPFIILKPRLKIVCSLHGRTFTVFESNYGKLKLLKPLFVLIERFSIKHIDVLAPVSNDVITSFEVKYPGFTEENRNKMIIASPIVNKLDYQILNELKCKQDLGLDESKTYLSCLGRLSNVKDIKFLLNLVNNKKNYFTDNNIILIIFGDGESKNSLLKLVNKLNLASLVIFYGEISSENIDKALGCSKLLLISSKHESGPIVMKEALLCGIPVISNDVGEVRDYIVNEKNGLIVEKSFNNYIAAIKKLLSMNLSKKEVINNSQFQLNQCSVEFIVKKYIEIY